MIQLDDCHAHTALSYCAEPGLSVRDYVDAMALDARLRTVAITNHGFAIYFPEDVAWSWRFMDDPSLFDAQRAWGNGRLLAHLAEVEAVRDRGLRTGIEVEMMADGRLTVDPALMDRLDVIVGSVHCLPSGRGRAPSDIVRRWMDHVRSLVRTGIHVLGHPLRWLASAVASLPAEVVPFVAEVAGEAGVAIEVNSHYVVEADLDLVREAARRGATIALATDSHRREEIGDFGYHLRLFERLGLRLEDLRLFAPPRDGR